MKKKIRILITLLAGIALLQACTQELPGEGLPVDGKLSLRLIVSAPAGMVTRADGAELSALENRIDSLEILFFDEEVCVWHPDSVSYDAATGNATIPLPVNPEIRSLFDGSTPYTIHVIANKPLDEMTGDSLTTLKNIILAENFTNNGTTPPSPFVMEGSVTSTLSVNGQSLGAVTLQRVFSKIRVRIKTGGTITPYMNGAYPQMALQNYKTEATLIYTGALPSSLPLKSDGFIAADSLVGEWLTTDYPYYSCPHNWSGAPGSETFLLVKISQTVEGVTSDHYYRVAFNYRILDESNMMVSNYGLNRNYFYDMELFIDQPGGSEEIPQAITGNHTIRDWTTQELYGSITSEIYLSLSEQTIFMDDVASYTFRYSSSLSTLTVKDVTYDGTVAPTFTVTPTDATSGTITINSAVPANYQPKHIAFTVTNTTTTSTGLDVKVEVIQTPAITIAQLIATKSQFTLEPSAVMSKNIYLITSAVSTATANLIVAFPRQDVNGYTDNSGETALMVSPRLMVASGIGNNTEMAYTNAQTYCSGYWETNSNGATYSDWRLPTLEELKLIDQLQDGSVISPGMSAAYYWDAQSSDGPYDMTTGMTNNSGVTTAMVRCVRDVKN